MLWNINRRAARHHCSWGPGRSLARISRLSLRVMEVHDNLGGLLTRSRRRGLSHGRTSRGLRGHHVTRGCRHSGRHAGYVLNVMVMMMMMGPVLGLLGMRRGEGSRGRGGMWGRHHRRRLLRGERVSAGIWGSRGRGGRRGLHASLPKARGVHSGTQRICV